MQTYFMAANFPANMEGVWDEHFAFVQRATKVPIVIGEMGGVYQGEISAVHVAASIDVGSALLTFGAGPPATKQQREVSSVDESTAVEVGDTVAEGHAAEIGPRSGDVLRRIAAGTVPALSSPL